MNRTAFFTLHRDLPREGPGLPDDVMWALSRIDNLPKTVLDAACGPGADTETLARVLPDARIDAVDKQSHFVEAAAARTAEFGDRVRVWQGDMSQVTGPYDMIWCAGAVYFLGIEEALRIWAPVLNKGGYIAFSEPYLPEWAGAAAKTFWDDYPSITDAKTIRNVVKEAGYQTIATRLIRGEAWQAYYGPIEERIASLRTNGLSAAVEEVCQAAEAEIEAWRAAPDDIAYLGVLVRL